MKLLAKGADERYQSAAGLERDLDAVWPTGASAPHRRFPTWPERHARPVADPRELYRESARGRDPARRISTHASFRATPQLMLVSGYSGIGRSAVVNELHKVLVPLHGLFASGKFDQVQARHSVFDLGAGVSRSCAASPCQERRRAGGFARRVSGCAGAECTAHDRTDPRTEAHRRRAAAGPGARAATGAEPVPAGIRTFYWRASPARNIRWRCSSTICNGSMRRRSICWRIC